MNCVTMRDIHCMAIDLPYMVYMAILMTFDMCYHEGHPILILYGYRLTLYGPYGYRNDF